jgi:hypothetical protein
MRGVYTFTRDEVTAGSAADVLGIIIPANTLIDVLDLPIWGKSASSAPLAIGLFRFTGNTPTLSQPITPRAKDPANALAAAVSWGGRGTGAQAVWSATPLTLDTEPFMSWGFNAFGGLFPWKADNYRRMALGGSSAMYVTMRVINGTGTIGYRCEYLE